MPSRFLIVACLTFYSMCRASEPSFLKDMDSADAQVRLAAARAARSGLIPKYDVQTKTMTPPSGERFRDQIKKKFVHLMDDSEDNIKCEAMLGIMVGFSSDIENCKSKALTLCKSANDDVRKSALELIGTSTSKAPEIGEALFVALDDPSPKVRHVAALFVSEKFSDRAKVIPKLIALTKDDDAAVRGNAMSGLSHYENLPNDAEETIRNGLNDPDQGVQMTAKEILDQKKKEAKGKNSSPAEGLQGEPPQPPSPSQDK